MTTQTMDFKGGVDIDQTLTARRPRILLVDDEPDNILLLKQIFQLNGYDVSGALSGKEALSKIHEVMPNLVVLDIMMPEMDGWQIYEQLRKISDVPVVVISAAAQTDYVVKALRMGADDYITKPFIQAEVIARVNGIMRRRGKNQNVNRIGFANIELIIDLGAQEIIYKGEHVQLTGRMFEVLLLLARNAPKVLPYGELTREIWGETSASAHNRLKYLVYLLRQEFLRIDPHSQVIKNVDRVGYKLATED
jgi:DNA-binding response OmpR family regulator